MKPRHLTPSIVALALLWLAMLLLGAGDADRAALLALYAADEPFLALAALWATFLGDWPTLVAVTLLGAAWLAYRNRYRAAILLLLASFSGRALVVLEKAWFARLRPEEICALPKSIICRSRAAMRPIR